MQMRDGIRDQVGMLIVGSSRVTMRDVGIHFMHGLGVVGQFSEDLTFERMDIRPRPETGRTVTGFADFIHLSGCKGRLTIRDSRFAGAHDDAINVHGTYLRIVGRTEPHQLLVRFMHPQTYGFPAFVPGDEVAFVGADSLTAYASDRIAAVEMRSARELMITLEGPLPEEIGERDVLENLTWTPEVEIIGNDFARIPTRGILATTPRRVVIRDNTFTNMHMSAVLVAADANSWYESGAVADLSVLDNRFIQCGGGEHPVIQIAPENSHSNVQTPVHRNIRIVGNQFVKIRGAVLSARSTKGLWFKHNEILLEHRGSSYGQPLLEEFVKLEGCTEVDINSNTLNVSETT